MGSPDEPWPDAHSLRLQVDGQIRVVEAQALQDPNGKLNDAVQNIIFTIVGVIQQRYGGPLFLDIELKKTVWEQSGAGPTVQEIWSILESVRASLLDIERFEAQQAVLGPIAEASSPWASSAQHFGDPPDEPESWPDDEEGRGYWSGARSQHRHAGANRSRQRPW